MTKPAAIVLCGGESRRMGRPKAALPFGPESMLSRVVRLAATAAAPIVVVAAPGQDLPPVPGSPVVVRDEVAGRGPLQGLAAGMRALPEEVELVYATATDVPFLQPAWIDRLVAEIGDHDLAMPFIGGYHHPLAALYRRATVGPAIDALLAADRLRPFFLVEAVRARIVAEETLREVDPTLGTLRNLNTPADYEAALHDAGLAPAGSAPEIAVEFYGVPRLRAGLARVAIRAAGLGDALAILAGRCPGLSDSVIVEGRLHPAYRLNLNGERFVSDPALALREGDTLIFLSADVGG